MDKNHCSFSQLPFSRLFQTYTQDFSRVKNFFVTNPFSDTEIKQRVSRIPQTNNREQVISALKSYHKKLGISTIQQQQIEKFSNPNALVIVTGQQLGIYGGPLYTVFKTITAIVLANEWEKKLNVPVIPIFWLADEDHDFEEITSVGIPSYLGKQAIKLKEHGSNIPVSEELITSSFDVLNEEISKAIQETEFSDALWEMLHKCYRIANTHATSFAQLICSWFADAGVLIAGSNHKKIKILLKSTFSTSVTKVDSIKNVLEHQSMLVEKQFHRQVMVGDTNLFMLGENGRSKFHLDQSNWVVDGVFFTKDQLLSLINSKPERFSPNVFLRPVIQDVLLPTIGYVAGPGELGYFAQMKPYYEEFGMEMPVIFPRLSATLLESSVTRIMEKLPFEMCNYNLRIEDLESKYIAMNSNLNIEKIFKKWIENLHIVSENPISNIQGIDSSLKGVSGKLMSVLENDINKLKSRVFKSLKQQENTQLKRIARIKEHVFPDGLQERVISPIYFMNKYGLDIWNKIITTFIKDDLDLSKHYVIKL